MAALRIGSLILPLEPRFRSWGCVLVLLCGSRPCYVTCYEGRTIDVVQIGPDFVSGHDEENEISPAAAG